MIMKYVLAISKTKQDNMEQVCAILKYVSRKEESWGPASKVCPKQMMLCSRGKGLHAETGVTLGLGKWFHS